MRHKETLAERILERQGKLSSMRSLWEQRWQDVVDYVMPFRYDVTSDPGKGSDKGQLMYDNTPTRSLNILAAGLMSYLTSQASPWFALRTNDLDLMDYEEVREYLQECQRRMFAVFNQSNFNTAVHEFYQDLGGFGTGAIFVEENWDYVCRFITMPPRECFIAENQHGQVDTLYRVYKQSARAIMQAHPDGFVTDTVKDASEKEPDKEFEIIHAIFPRTDHDADKVDAQNMPFASVYVEKGEKSVIKESGYESFPAMVARWSKNSGEIYGRSPAIDNMCDIKTLHAQGKTILKAGQRAADPPLSVPTNFKGRVRTTPAALNYYKSGTQDRVEAMNVQGNIPVSLEMQDRNREMVSQGFFSDVFLMLAQRVGNMTATEVIERVQERLVVLGPVLGRLHSEALGPLVERTFLICERVGYLPERPEVLEGEQPQVEYISPLAKAQKAAEGKGVQDALLFLEPIFAIDPQAADKIDADEMVEKAWEIFGAPQETLRAEQEVNQIREFRQAQQAIEQRKTDIERAAQVGKLLSDSQGAAPMLPGGLGE